MGGIWDERIGRLVASQTGNGSLGGDDLRAAADEVAAFALSHGLALRACDDTGERIVGAALVLHPACVSTDTTARLDGLDVLLVSGAAAGPFGLTRAARLASNLGARTVRAAMLGGWPGDVTALDGPVIGVGSRPTPDVPLGRTTETHGRIRQPVSVPTYDPEPAVPEPAVPAPAACWACVFDSEPEHSCGGIPADLIPGFHRAF